MTKAGYINGNDGKLNPTDTITREEFAQVMYNIFSCYISEPGIYTDNITGNMIISSDSVTLKGITITGDLILGEGVGNGDVTLDGVNSHRKACDTRRWRKFNSHYKQLRRR